jgi:hypothetical protein
MQGIDCAHSRGVGGIKNKRKILYKNFFFGLKYFFIFFDYFEHIANNPYQFPSADHIRKGYRYCVCGSDTVYFRVTEDVEIMAIVGWQDLENKLL